ncbi:tRNA (N6-isopentenyl adenosine(37)-C2)-methylthiotransferase MiaB [Candidatus Kuenenbacteria bacterium]|nr:tRNA (N6-isopentenyl adenosine(37)-C2)-methylthiotransferase MiaB [Candidatus Kuenenbacteria bacterium]
MKKYHIITFGCQMNKSDSERIVAVFEHLNCSSVDAPEEADVVVVNSCSVRQAPIDRVWGLLKIFDEIKLKREISVILTGCILPEDKIKFEKRYDFVFDIKELNLLEKYLTQSGATPASRLTGDGTEQQLYTDENYFSVLPKSSSKYKAFVPIMTGCNNYCSYCAVPYVRGREESRSVKEVLSEANHLVANGAKEVTLLGQNVNSYAPADLESFSKANPFHQPFAKLLWEVNQIDNIDRIGFLSSHPKDLHDDIIQAFSLPKMSNYLHLALQSGDNQVLEKMNRKYTIEDYEKLISKLRQVRPDIAIGTDIIVGFPGETVQQFENTLKAFDRIQFDIAYHAMYSPRSGTTADKLEDDVSQEEKRRRWHQFQDQMKKIVLLNNQKYVGQKVSVLIDTVEDDYVEGNSREMKRVQIKNSGAQIGDIVEVEVKKAREWVFYG